jgi:hypothetical protein
VAVRVSAKVDYALRAAAELAAASDGPVKGGQIAYSSGPTASTSNSWRTM